jgi:hypothetical protein
MSKKPPSPTTSPAPEAINASPSRSIDPLYWAAKSLPWMAALLVWIILNPGIFPPDATHIVYFALTKDFCNPHPVILTVIARQVINLFLYPGVITLIQALFITYGLRFLAVNILILTDPLSVHDARRREIRAATILLILFSPLTPLIFLMVAFLKDCWMLGGLAWMTGLMAGIARRDQERSGSAEAFLIVACSAATAFSILFRYNSVVLLPVFCLLMFFLINRKSLRWLAVLPIVFLVGANVIMKAQLNVRDEYPERQVMFLDIVGLCVLNPALESEFPELISQSRPDYASRYEFGDVMSLYNVAPFNTVMYGNEQPRRDGFRTDAVIPTIYPRVFKHLWKLTQVKVISFARLYFSTSYQEVFMRGVFNQPIQMPENPRFASLRSQLFAFYDIFTSKSPFRWLMSVHSVWNIGGLFLAFWLIRRKHALRWLILIPVAYPFTFLPATTAMDFRFLVPSTMVLQVFVLAMLLTRSWPPRQVTSA